MRLRVKEIRVWNPDPALRPGEGTAQDPAQKYVSGHGIGTRYWDKVLGHGIGTRYWDTVLGHGIGTKD